MTFSVPEDEAKDFEAHLQAARRDVTLLEGVETVVSVGVCACVCCVCACVRALMCVCARLCMRDHVCVGVRVPACTLVLKLPV